MFIQTENTPNPQSLKFLPGRSISPDDVHMFSKGENAQISPLAQEILAIEGVKSVFLGHTFVTVTKEGDHFDWEDLRPFVLATMMDFFSKDLPIIHASAP